MLRTSLIENVFARQLNPLPDITHISYQRLAENC